MVLSEVPTEAIDAVSDFKIIDIIRRRPATSLLVIGTVSSLAYVFSRSEDSSGKEAMHRGRGGKFIGGSQNRAEKQKQLNQIALPDHNTKPKSLSARSGRGADSQKAKKPKTVKHQRLHNPEQERE